VKLIRRERVSYILCLTDKEKGKLQEIAIHRIKLPISLSEKEYVEPATFGINLSAKNLPQEPRVDGRWGELQKIVLEIEGPPAQHLSEVRFHPDPKDSHLTKRTVVRKVGDVIYCVRLEIQNIEYNYEFKCWLLGLGSFCRVIEAIPAKGVSINPVKDLREEIAKMTQNYNK
jgi:hypothetical protein